MLVLHPATRATCAGGCTWQWRISVGGDDANIFHAVWTPASAPTQLSSAMIVEIQHRQSTQLCRSSPPTQRVLTGPLRYLNLFLSAYTCLSHSRKAQYLQRCAVTAHTQTHLSGSSSSSSSVTESASAGRLSPTACSNRRSSATKDLTPSVQSC